MSNDELHVNSSTNHLSEVNGCILEGSKDKTSVPIPSQKILPENNCASSKSEKSGVVPDSPQQKGSFTLLQSKIILTPVRPHSVTATKFREMHNLSDTCVNRIASQLACLKAKDIAGNLSTAPKSQTDTNMVIEAKENNTCKQLAENEAGESVNKIPLKQVTEMEKDESLKKVPLKSVSNQIHIETKTIPSSSIKLKLAKVTRKRKTSAANSNEMQKVNGTTESEKSSEEASSTMNTGESISKDKELFTEVEVIECKSGSSKDICQQPPPKVTSLQEAKPQSIIISSQKTNGEAKVKSPHEASEKTYVESKAIFSQKTLDEGKKDPEIKSTLQTSEDTKAQHKICSQKTSNDVDLQKPSFSESDDIVEIPVERPSILETEKKDGKKLEKIASVELNGMDSVPKRKISNDKDQVISNKLCIDGSFACSEEMFVGFNSELSSSKALKILSPTQINKSVNKEDSAGAQSNVHDVNAILKNYLSSQTNVSKKKLQSCKVKDTNEIVPDIGAEFEIEPSTILECDVGAVAADAEKDSFVKSQNYQLNCEVRVLVKRLLWEEVTSQFCYENNIKLTSGTAVKRFLRKHGAAPPPGYTRRKLALKRKLPEEPQYTVDVEPMGDPFSHSIFGSLVTPRPKNLKVRKRNFLSNKKNNPGGPNSMAMRAPFFSTPGPSPYSIQAPYMVSLPHDVLLLTPTNTGAPSMPIVNRVGLQQMPAMGRGPMNTAPTLQGPHILKQAITSKTPTVESSVPTPPIITLDDHNSPSSFQMPPENPDLKPGYKSSTSEEFSCKALPPSKFQSRTNLYSVYPAVKTLLSVGYPKDQRTLFNLVYQLLVGGPSCCMSHAVQTINNCSIDIITELSIKDVELTPFVRPIVPCIARTDRNFPPNTDTFIIKRFVFAISKNDRKMLFPLPPFCVPKENTIVDKVTVLFLASAKHGVGPGLMVFPHAILTPELRDSFGSYAPLSNWCVSGHQSGGLTQSMLKEFLTSVAVPWMRTLKSFEGHNILLVDWWWSAKNEDLPQALQQFRVLNLQELYSPYHDPLDIHLGMNLQRLWGLLYKKWVRINSRLLEQDFPRFFLQSTIKLLGASKLTDLAIATGMLPLNFQKAAKFTTKQANY